MKELHIILTPGDHFRIPLRDLPLEYAAYLQRCDLSKATVRIIDTEDENEKENTPSMGDDGC